MMLRLTHTALFLALLGCGAVAACSSSSGGDSGAGGDGAAGGASFDGRSATDGVGAGTGGSTGAATDGGAGAGTDGGAGAGTGGSSGSSNDGGAAGSGGGSGEVGAFDTSGNPAEAGGAADSGGLGDVGGFDGKGGAGEAGGALDGGGLDSRAPAAPPWVPSGQTVTWSDYTFTIPATMKVIADGSQGYYAIGRTGCALTFFPAVANGADADAQAKSLLTEAFSDAAKWSGLLGIDNSDPLLGTYHRRTVTAQGLPAVDLSSGLKNSEGRVTSELARILLVDLGTGKSAPIIGYQVADDSRCINEVLDPYEWVFVYYSLSFPQARPVNPQGLQDALIGGWFSSSSGSIVSIGGSQVYAANGNYSYATSVTQYAQIAPDLIRETTSSWAGDGAWRLEHGLLEILPRDLSAPTQTNLIRIFREYNPQAASGWHWYLYTMESCGGAPCEAWAAHE